jgi:CHAT domain-containing protein
VLAIADLFDRGDSRVYTGPSFTGQTVLAELARPNRVVHFATHAIFDEKVPSRSGIVVSRRSGPPEAAPIVRAADIAGLQVRADLITLSGCQTGLGQVVDGEGVMGLAWAFNRAGAGSLVVTLWNVSDTSTEAAMVAFYRALRAGESKAAALLTARRQLLHGPNPALRHPYYWAAFALIGDAR